VGGRPDAATRYFRIDSLFGDNAIDWDPIERDLHSRSRVSSVTLLRGLGTTRTRTHLYRAFRELGMVIRTVTLLRYLSEPRPRATPSTPTT
jgi:TnpA family transposase